MAVGSAGDVVVEVVVGGDVVVVMLFVSFDFQVVAATAGGFYCALCLKRVVGVTPQLRIPACLAQSRGTCNTHRSRERFKRM